MVFSSTYKAELISAAQLLKLLSSVGLRVSLSDRQAIAEAFQTRAGFNKEDFVNIAESLGYSRNANDLTNSALKVMSQGGYVLLESLERHLSVCGKEIGLSREEARSFLLYQLGSKDFVKGRVSLEDAQSLLN